MRSAVGNDSRPGKEEKVFLLHDFPDTFLFRRNYIDVITSENEKFGDLPQNIGSRLRPGMADDPIQSWLLEPVGILNGWMEYDRTPTRTNVANRMTSPVSLHPASPCQ